MNRTDDDRLSRFHYSAFLSYSHRDRSEAELLHRSVERWAIPRTARPERTRSRLSPVFMDTQELATGVPLPVSIRRALQQSAWLLVLCTPRSAASEWVDAEIRHFVATHGEGFVIPVIGHEVSVSMEVDDVLPSALSCHQVLCADLRGGRRSFDLALMKIFAGMLGVGLDDLIQRANARRSRRRLLGLATAFAALASLAGGGGVLRISQLEARVALQEAEAEAAGRVSTEVVAGEMTMRAQAAITRAQILASSSLDVLEHLLFEQPEPDHATIRTLILFLRAYYEDGPGTVRTYDGLYRDETEQEAYFWSLHAYYLSERDASRLRTEPWTVLLTRDTIEVVRWFRIGEQHLEEYNDLIVSSLRRSAAGYRELTVLEPESSSHRENLATSLAALYERTETSEPLRAAEALTELTSLGVGEIRSVPLAPGMQLRPTTLLRFLEEYER